jgi:8-oxo-dGTP diphosphatase
MRKVVSGIVLRERELLLVRKGETWILPGGKPEEGESDEDCLRREFREELSKTEIKNIRPYKAFKGRAPHTGDVVSVHYYFVKTEKGIGGASGEISGFTWARSKDHYKLSESASKVYDSLESDGYLE